MCFPEFLWPYSLVIITLMSQLYDYVLSVRGDICELLKLSALMVLVTAYLAIMANN